MQAINPEIELWLFDLVKHRKMVVNADLALLANYGFRFVPWRISDE
ncbi:hypothetical protein ACFFQF_30050 [Haladaptatus pallidirubidus]